MAGWHDFWKSSEARRSSRGVSAQADCWFAIPSTLNKSHHSSKCFPRLYILMHGRAPPHIPHTLTKHQRHHDIVSSDNDWNTLDTYKLIHKVNLCLVADRKRQWCCEIALYRCAIRDWFRNQRFKVDINTNGLKEVSTAAIRMWVRVVKTIS